MNSAWVFRLRLKSCYGRNYCFLEYDLKLRIVNQLEVLGMIHSCDAVSVHVRGEMA